MRIRTYSELRRIDDFKERFEYLALRGRVGETTFGFDRWMNQKFYTSMEWRNLRNHIIVRDKGCDLGVEGHDVRDRLYVHHLKPMTVNDIQSGDPSILDPEYLITTTLATHNAIHYGDERQLPRLFMTERKMGDTKLW